MGAEGLVEFGGGERLPLQLLHHVFHLDQWSEIPVSRQGKYISEILQSTLDLPELGIEIWQP